MSSSIEAKTIGEKAEMIAGMEESDRFMIKWGYSFIHVDKTEINLYKHISDLMDFNVSKLVGGTVSLERKDD